MVCMGYVRTLDQPLHFEDLQYIANMRCYPTGPVVRMYPGCYSIDDPAAMKIYGQTQFKKSEWHIALSNPMPEWPQNIFAERDPKKHAESRKKIASLYSMTSLVKMEQAVDETIALFQVRLMEAEKDGRVINMQFWLQCFAFDTVGLITASSQPYTLLFMTAELTSRRYLSALDF